MPNINCSYCNKVTYKKPSEIKKSKTGYLYCSSNCHNEHRRVLKRMELEEKVGCNLRDYIYKKYVIEKKPTTWIMKELGINSHYITDLLREFNITAREGSERYRNWWNSLSGDQQKKYIESLSNRAKKNLTAKEGRKKLRVAMNSKEYKAKISAANSGTNNGMYDPTLTQDHRVKTRGLFGYKKWALKVKQRDKYTCQKCRIKGTTKQLHAHHIDDYFKYKDGRLDLDNGITLCASCHSIFHNRYRGQIVTKRLFDEFMNKE